jgi:hypothetical protein
MPRSLAPEHDLSPFLCPHCGISAKQEWFQRLAGLPKDAGPAVFAGFHAALCHGCGLPNIWRLMQAKGDDDRWELVYPQRMEAPAPAAGMPSPVLDVYLEARAIAHNSPRAAAALLRLAVELLLDHLGAEGHSLNDKVGWLVRQGVARNLQQALDGVRVSGNKAAHALQIVPDEPREVSDLLFRLVNYIVETLVTGREEIQTFYNRLSDAARRAITTRDEMSACGKTHSARLAT